MNKEVNITDFKLTEIVQIYLNEVASISDQSHFYFEQNFSDIKIKKTNNHQSCRHLDDESVDTHACVIQWNIDVVCLVFRLLLKSFHVR